MDNTDGSNTILVLENHRQTLTVTRSLSRAGFNVLLGQDETGDSGAFVATSNSVDSVWSHPPLRKRRFGQELETLARSRPLAGIFPVGEEALMQLARFEPKADGIPLALSRPALRCLDKLAIYEVARAEGVPCAGARMVDSFREIEKLAQQHGFPFILKQADSSELLLGEKCLYVRCEDDLAELRRSLFRLNQNVVYQREIKGLRHNCMFSAVDGELRNYFESKVHRTDSPNGSGFAVLSESVRPTPMLVEFTRTLARSLDYNGIGCAQYLVDAQLGEVTFLELNPRLDATAGLPYSCGVDFPKEALRCAGILPDRRLALPPGRDLAYEPGYAVGRRAHWLWGDINAYLHLVADHKLTWQEAWRRQFALVRDALSCDQHILSLIHI